MKIIVKAFDFYPIGWVLRKDKNLIFYFSPSLQFIWLPDNDNGYIICFPSLNLCWALNKTKRGQYLGYLSSLQI